MCLLETKGSSCRKSQPKCQPAANVRSAELYQIKLKRKRLACRLLLHPLIHSITLLL